VRLQLIPRVGEELREELVFNCSSYTFKLSYSVRVVKCSHKPLKNKREIMTIKSKLGFSVSKFWGVIHHSWRYPTPPVPLGHHTRGIADVFLVGQIPTVGTSFILRLCNRWYSFIHRHSGLLPHHHSYAKDASKRRILSYTTGTHALSVWTSRSIAWRGIRQGSAFHWTQSRSQSGLGRCPSPLPRRHCRTHYSLVDQPVYQAAPIPNSS
jgi:hypothetical protein